MNILPFSRSRKQQQSLRKIKTGYTADPRCPHQPRGRQTRQRAHIPHASKASPACGWPNAGAHSKKVQPQKGIRPDSRTPRPPSPSQQEWVPESRLGTNENRNKSCSRDRETDGPVCSGRSIEGSSSSAHKRRPWSPRTDLVIRQSIHELAVATIKAVIAPTRRGGRARQLKKICDSRSAF